LCPLSEGWAEGLVGAVRRGETLLGKTATRARALAGVADVVTVTNRDLYFHTRDVYTALRSDRTYRDTFLLEPFRRNTAPAVALAAMIVLAMHGDDAILLAMPADHLISDHAAFRAAVERAVALARRGPSAREGLLGTFGIRPTHPETGFGYLECGAAIDGGAPPAARVERFVEKPSLDKARAYVAAAAAAGR